MTTWRNIAKRKKTGGRVKRYRKKKKMDRSRDFIPAVVGETKKLKVRMRGGKEKVVLVSSDTANIIVDGKAQKVKILNVIENKADPHFVRRNIITKGAIIETEAGKAIVTSRPGQDGVINAKLIEKK